MFGIRAQSMMLASLLVLTLASATFAQSAGGSSGGSASGGGAGAASAASGPGGSMSGGTPGPAATGALPQPQPSGTDAGSNNGQTGTILPPILPPGAGGTSPAPDRTGSTTARPGVSTGGSFGNQTGLGNIGPETEKEKRAQEESDRATRSLCNGC